MTNRSVIVAVENAKYAKRQKSKHEGNVKPNAKNNDSKRSL